MNINVEGTDPTPRAMIETLSDPNLNLTKQSIQEIFLKINSKKLSFSPQEIKTLNLFYSNDLRLAMDKNLEISEFFKFKEFMRQANKSKADLPTQKFAREISKFQEIRQIFDPNLSRSNQIHVIYYENTESITTFSLIAHSVSKIVHFCPNDTKDEYAILVQAVLYQTLRNARKDQYEQLIIKVSDTYQQSEGLRPLLPFLGLQDILCSFVVSDSKAIVRTDRHTYFSCKRTARDKCKELNIEPKNRKYISKLCFFETKCMNNHFLEKIGENNVFGEQYLMKAFFVNTYPHLELTFQFLSPPMVAPLRFNDCQPGPSSENFVVNTNIMAPSRLQFLNSTEVDSFFQLVTRPTNLVDDYATPITLEESDEEAEISQDIGISSLEGIFTSAKVESLARAETLRDALRIANNKNPSRARKELSDILRANPFLPFLWEKRESENKFSFIHSFNQAKVLNKILSSAKCQVPFSYKLSNVNSFLRLQRKRKKSSFLRTENQILALARDLKKKWSG